MTDRSIANLVPIPVSEYIIPDLIYPIKKITYDDDNNLIILPFKGSHTRFAAGSENNILTITNSFTFDNILSAG